MFEVLDRRSFASEVFVDEQSGQNRLFISELWIPNATQTEILKTADYKCACCGLVSAPGIIELNARHLASPFIDSASVMLKTGITQQVDTQSIPIPSGLMDILYEAQSATVLCWVCRTAKLPSLSVCGSQEHGHAIYADKVNQSEITKLFLLCMFTMIPADADLSVEAEKLLTKLRTTLVPLVTEILPTVPNGLIQDVAAIANNMPPDAIEGMLNHIRPLKYLPSRLVYSTHTGYWHKTAGAENNELMAGCHA